MLKPKKTLNFEGKQTYQPKGSQKLNQELYKLVEQLPKTIILIQYGLKQSTLNKS